MSGGISHDIRFHQRFRRKRMSHNNAYQPKGRLGLVRQQGKGLQTGWDQVKVNFIGVLVSCQSAFDNRKNLKNRYHWILHNSSE
jgi:hypothetical protein